jgi:FAD/FMN-containing dehydrogenase
VLADLSSLVGSDHVLDPSDGASAYLQDATQSAGIRGRAAAVVRPGDAEEVAAVVRWCYERGVPIVPRGGGTGYAGGAVPLDDAAVVLSLERLDRMRSFEPFLWRMEAEAGVLTATIARRARENGLLYPPDPGSAESSQIGGNVATNAGGPHSFKHGVTRAWVTGLEAVLAPGELVRIGGPARKDVAGYDLVSLLCGAEGTLGVVTAAALRLIPAPEASLPVAAFYPSAGEGQAAIEAVLGSGVVPAALEFLDAGAIGAGASSFPGGAPQGAGLLLVAEADGSEAEAQRASAELVEAMGEGALEVRSWETMAEARALWRWREGVSLAVTAQRGGKLSEDIAVPVDQLAEAIT